MKIHLIIISFLAAFSSFAQKGAIDYDNVFWPFDIVRDNLIPFRPYQTVHILEEADTSLVKERDLYGQAWMTALCFAGDIRKKNEVAEKIREISPVLQKEELLEASIQAFPAKPIVIREASKTSLTMINEAHLYPEHRVFVKSLLKDLYAIGYRHFCVEDLAVSYSPGESAEVPQQTDGFYINEICMGDLIREAARIGFQLYAYDAPGTINRDSIAARNILAVYEKHPEEKVLVYCGFSHNMEHRKSSCVAAYLQRIAGLDPLTIDQTVYCEKEQSVYYTHLIDFYQIDQPVVLVSGDTICRMNIAYCDFHILTPPTRYTHDRPHWLRQIDRRVARPLDPSFKEGIVEVYRWEEFVKYKLPVPIDIVRVEATCEKPDLLLPPTGRFVCKYYDPAYKLVYMRIL